jgi:hypothetical protein
MRAREAEGVTPLDTFEELYRRIGVLKRRRAELEADLRAAYMPVLREALKDKIRCTEAELDDAFLRIKALQDGMQSDLFGG